MIAADDASCGWKRRVEGELPEALAECAPTALGNLGLAQAA